MAFVIWYRESCLEHGELSIMEKHFKCVDSRIKINPNDFVISRYSCLPYYEEQAKDIDYLGAKLINSYREHRYVADIGNYYLDIKDFTPKTWFSLEEIDEEGPFVLKGCTNSRKGRWRTHMFAKNKKEAANVYYELTLDPLFQDSRQQICIRKFVNLFKYFDGINGMPVTKEFRFFMYKDTILSSGYYWSTYADDLDSVPSSDEVPIAFIKKVASQIGNNVNFYIIDVGQLENGEWIVIELNDAQMGGLSENNPEVLYSNLAKAVSLI